MVAKTAYIFSGIDGLDSLQDRIKILSVPAVRQRITQAQEILDLDGIEFSLAEFISSSDENYKKDLTLQAMAVSIVQIGLFLCHMEGLLLGLI